MRRAKRLCRRPLWWTAPEEGRKIYSANQAGLWQGKSVVELMVLSPVGVFAPNRIIIRIPTAGSDQGTCA